MAVRKRSVGQIVFTLSATAASLFGMFFALFIAALTCDESCSELASSWHDDPHAWQWGCQLGVAAFATLASIWALVSAIRRHSAWPALGVSAIAWAS